MAKNEAKAINKKEKKEKNVKDKTSFFKSFKGELKKVSWPTPKQLVNNTIAVIVIVVVIAVIVFVLDLAFDAMNKYGLDKLKESVVTTTEDNKTEENTVQPEVIEGTEVVDGSEVVDGGEVVETPETTEVDGSEPTTETAE